MVSMQELEEGNNEFYSNPRSDYVKYQIWDTTGAEKIIVSDPEIEFFAAVDLAASYSIRNIKVAFVGNDPKIRSQMETFIKHSIELGSTWIMKMFSDIEHAREWVESAKQYPSHD